MMNNNVINKGVIVNELKRYNTYIAKVNQLQLEITNRRTTMGIKSPKIGEQTPSGEPKTEIDILMEVREKEQQLLKYQENIAWVDNLLSILSDVDRNIITARYIHGYTNKSISNELDYSISQIDRRRANSLDVLSNAVNMRN